MEIWNSEHQEILKTGSLEEDLEIHKSGILKIWESERKFENLQIGKSVFCSLPFPEIHQMYKSFNFRKLKK